VVLEGVVTTMNPDGSVNIAPMGPLVDESMTRLCLRPYRSSTTYENLKRSGEGVFHVTDDVALIAQTAVGDPPSDTRLLEVSAVTGRILADACRWYAFRAEEFNEDQDRPRIECRVVDRGRLRDFFGFNRAKHAVIEAAILATRTRFLPPEEIAREFDRLRVVVEKTGGEQERHAFALLEKHVSKELDG
jgi:hypothetical protein